MCVTGSLKTRYTYPDSAVVEEEPEHGRPRDRGLRHGLLHGAPNDGLQLGADVDVVVRPKLSHGRRRHERRDEDSEREEGQSKASHIGG